MYACCWRAARTSVSAVTRASPSGCHCMHCTRLAWAVGSARTTACCAACHTHVCPAHCIHMMSLGGLNVVGAHRWSGQSPPWAVWGAIGTGWAPLGLCRLHFVDLPGMRWAGGAAPPHVGSVAAGRWGRQTGPVHAGRVPANVGDWASTVEPQERALLHPKCCVLGSSGTSTTL